MDINNINNAPASSSPRGITNNDPITIHLKSGQTWDALPSVVVPSSLSLLQLKTTLSHHLGDTPSPDDIVLAFERGGGLVELKDVVRLKNEETLFVFPTLRAMLSEFADRDEDAIRVWEEALKKELVSSSLKLIKIAASEVGWRTFLGRLASAQGGSLLESALSLWRSRMKETLQSRASIPPIISNNKLKGQEQWSPATIQFKYGSYNLSLAELTTHCIIDRDLALDGVVDFCKKKVDHFKAAFFAETVPYFIVGCWEHVFVELAHAAGWKLQQLSPSSEKDRLFNKEQAVLHSMGGLHVLRVPPGRDIVRMYGQAHNWFLSHHQKGANHVRCFHVPELTEHLQVYSTLTEMNWMDIYVKDAIVVVGAVEKLSTLLESKQSVARFKKEKDWAHGRFCSVELWRKDNHRIVLLGCKLSFWGNMAYTLACRLFEMGARELIHAGMKVGTLVSDASIRKRAFCPEKFWLLDWEKGLVHLEGVCNSILTRFPFRQEASHLSIPTPLDESNQRIQDSKETGGITSVDDEGAYFAQASQKYGRTFGAIYFASDFVRESSKKKSAVLACAHLGSKSEEDKVKEESLLAEACSLVGDYLFQHSEGVKIIQLESIPMELRTVLRDAYCRYKLLMFPDKDHQLGQMELCKAFVQLDVVVEPKEEREQEEGARSERQQISIDVLLEEHRRKVFLEGAPGAGKSTVCNYVAQMWALGRKPFAGFDLVARIDLSDLSPCNTITPSSIAKRILEKANQTPNNEQLQQFDKDVRSGSLNVLWIFDSLDEAKQMTNQSDNFREFLSNGLFNTEWLRDVIVTSRPGHWEKNWQQPAKRVQLQPFDDGCRMEYVRAYFHGQQNKVKQFEEHANRDRSLAEASSNPLTLQLMCFALNQLKMEQHVTLTTLYKTALTQCVPDRLLAVLRVEHDAEREDLCAAWMAVLTRLARMDQTTYELRLITKIAKEEYKACEVTFHPEACSEHVRDLNVLTHSGSGWTFGHFTFREFFIARGMAEEGEDVSLSRKERIVRFAVGLGSKEYATRMMTKIEKKALRQQDVEDGFGMSHGRHELEFFCACLAEVDPLFELSATWSQESLSSLLQVFASRGDVRLVEYLVDRGTNASKVDLSGATRGSHLDVIAYLANKGADVNPAISAAASKGDMKLIDELMKLKGADLSKVNPSDAAENGRLDVIKYLVDNGADVNQQVGRHRKLLVAFYAEKGNLEMVKYLVDKGADVSKVDLTGAARNGHLDVIKYLADKGVDVTKVILDAVSKGDIWLVRELMKIKGADASKLNLTDAAWHGHLDVIKYLVDNGANLHPPLRAACQIGQFEMVDYLVDKGADVNLPDEFGTAPLLLAAAFGHEDIVKFLLSRGGKLEESHTRRSVAEFREQTSGHMLTTALVVLEKVGAKDALSLLKRCMDEPRGVMKSDDAVDSGSIENSNN